MLAMLLSASCALAQPVGRKVAEGSFYLYNIDRQQYLGTAADGSLTLAASGTAITLQPEPYNGAPFYTLTINGKPLAADVWQKPSTDGAGTCAKWLFTPLSHTTGQGYVYAVGNMQRQANACAQLRYSAADGALGTSYAMPAAQGGGGAWMLVSAADYDANTVVMDEAATAYTRPAYADASHPATVLLKRKLTINAWNSFCLPFSLSAQQMADAFQKAESADTRYWLAQFTEYDADGVLHFQEVTDGAQAGEPYLLYPTKVSDDTQYTFTGVTTFAEAPHTVTHGAGCYVPTFVKGTAPTGSYVLSKNEVYHLTKDTPLNGFRGYFTETSQQRINTWTLDSAPTAINTPWADSQAPVPFRVYSVDGRLLKTGATTLDALPRGVYMIKGKKVTK